MICMPEKFQSTGTCYLCKKSVAKRSILKHLESCLGSQQGPAQPATQDKQRSVPAFLLKIEDKYAGVFFLVIEISGKATLTDLDQFLKNIWLECCSHMSDFTINEVIYQSYPESGEESMDKTVQKIFTPKLAFEYTYDYGSSTELKLHIIKETTSINPTNKTMITILARNDPIPVPCTMCEKPAQFMCSECMYDEEGEGLLCAKCAKKHECGEDMLLPVINSPRAGVCAYMGPSSEEGYLLPG